MLSLPELIVPASLADMQSRAIEFLLGRQEANGAWRDFFLPAGESTDWVTGYVALALADQPGGEAAARRGWAYLETAAKPDGGWGYNALTPSDADSSIWALRLAEASGARDSDCARRGRAFLAEHHRPGGGIATYASADGPRGYVGLPDTVDFSAWTSPHVCVSAAVAGLVGELDPGLRAYLDAAQAADGHWPSYWWFDPGYATAEAVEALGVDYRSMQFARARIDTLLRTNAPSGFTLAHAIRILGPDTPPAALDALADLQCDNGSWPASARLRVPAPDCAVPLDDAPWRAWHGLAAMPTTLDQVMAATFTITSLDHRRVCSTATVLRALSAVRR